jgi:phosphohistidine phosphatase
MGEKQPPTVLYLVRHGRAKPKDEDPERSLSEVGKDDVFKMAAWADRAGIHVDEIRHSGKARARQTAELFAARLGTSSPLPVSGLGPNDDVGPLAESLRKETRSVMLVGHLPLLERLAALLITGRTDQTAVCLDAGGLLVLRRTEVSWTTIGLMQPSMLP